MPKPNYKYEKRQKEIAKQKKKAQKLRRKQEKKPVEVEPTTKVEDVAEKSEQSTSATAEETNKE